jgi:hypothetical protein
VRWVGLTFVVVWLAAREAKGVDGPSAERSLQIWYRSTTGCPDGAMFVHRLTELGREAHLASVGDRVDFVVTVAHAAEQSSGRLERQTELGTMAIREISAGRCDEVVEGLALSLDLALDPIEKRSIAVPEHEVREVWSSSFGAGPTLTTAIAPDPMFGVSLNAELSHVGGASLLLVARGARRQSGVSPDLDITLALLEARAVGCPLGWRGGAWMLQPCLGASLGWLGAESPAPEGHSDDALWTSGTAFARVSWRAADALGVYLDAGAVFPFVRYELGAETGAPVFRTGAVGLDAALGIAWWPP